MQVTFLLLVCLGPWIHTAKSKMNLLIWCFFLLIPIQHNGVEAVYCIKNLPCSATECFKVMNSINAVCTSSQETKHCSISGTHIKLECDVQLQCFCKEGPFQLDDLPEIHVRDQSSISMKHELHPEETKRYEGDPSTSEVSERNNTNTTESSGFSITSFLIGAGAVAGAVMIICLIMKAVKKLAIPTLQGRKKRDSQCSGSRKKYSEELALTNVSSPPAAKDLVYASGTQLGNQPAQGPTAGRDRPTDTTLGRGPKQGGAGSHALCLNQALPPARGDTGPGCL